MYITGRRKKKIGTTVKRDGRIRSAPVGVGETRRRRRTTTTTRRRSRSRIGKYLI